LSIVAAVERHMAFPKHIMYQVIFWHSIPYSSHYKGTIYQPWCYPFILENYIQLFIHSLGVYTYLKIGKDRSKRYDQIYNERKREVKDTEEKKWGGRKVEVETVE